MPPSGSSASRATASSDDFADRSDADGPWRAARRNAAFRWCAVRGCGGRGRGDMASIFPGMGSEGDDEEDEEAAVMAVTGPSLATRVVCADAGIVSFGRRCGGGCRNGVGSGMRGRVRVRGGVAMAWRDGGGGRCARDRLDDE